MITRKLGGLLRGNATPFQLMAASVIGTLIGFAPAFTQAPALYVMLLAVLLIANANLGLALLCVGLGRMLSFASAALSFSIGRVLLDGPTSGIAHSLVNAPVLAWCGLEYYAVSGGQALGLLVGTAIGLAITRSVRHLRERMLASQANPSRIRELAAKPWARFLLWLFMGGTGKQTWEEKLAVRVGNPIRIWGALLMLVLLVGTYFGQQSLAGPLASGAFKAGLESSNGATVNLGSLEFNLREGQLALHDLAMADASALGTDIFRASHLEADLGQADFLRKRLHINRLVAKGAGSGLTRAQPGALIARPTQEAAQTESPPSQDRADFSLEDLMEDYGTWKERLTQLKGWMDKLSPALSKTKESDSELRQRQMKQGAWFSIPAEHLIDEAPSFRLSELVVEDFESSYLPGRKLNLHGSELSTHPHLVDAPPRLELNSQDGLLSFLVDLAPASKAGGDGALRMSWKGLEVDQVMSLLRLPVANPFRGGNLELLIDGSWDQGRIGWIDLPLQVTLHNTTFAWDGGKPSAVEQLTLAIGLKGPIDAPSISFDSTALTDALLAAGKSELANRLKSQLDGKLGGKLDTLTDKLGDQDGLPPEAKGLLKGLFGEKRE